MKVKIQQRSVYHQFAEIEIEIPDDVNDIQYYLLNNEDRWVESLDDKANETCYIYGTGLDLKGMEFPSADSEWRYETEKEGGHL